MHPCFSHFTKLCRVLCTTSPHCIRRLHKIKEFQLKSSVHSCAAVQLCSCAVVQLCILNCDGFWQKTPLTGHKWPGWEKNRLELEIKLSFSMYFFYNKSFESMNTYERYIRFSSNAWLPLIPDPPPPRLFSQLFKIITRVHSQSHPWQPLKAMCSVWNAATQPYSALFFTDFWYTAGVLRWKTVCRVGISLEPPVRPSYQDWWPCSVLSVICCQTLRFSDPPHCVLL